MKKVMILGLLILTILSISGCSEIIYSAGQPQTLNASLRKNYWENEWNSIKDDFEDVIQEIQIYSVGGEMLLTITDNKEIFIFTKNLEIDKWDYSLKEIPPESLKLCTYVSRLEQDGQMVTQAVNTVYHDKNGYYHLTEAPDGYSQNRMSDQSANNLITLAGLELSDTQKFSDHEYYEFARNGKISMYDVVEYYPPFAGLTYEGMLAASAENLIEIHKDGAVIQSISNNQEVYEFLVSLNTSEWYYIEKVPDPAIQICTIVRYQLGRREFAGQLIEQSRLLLYHDGVDYYMDNLITDNGSGQGNKVNELYPQHFRVPVEIGERFST